MACYKIDNIFNDSCINNYFLGSSDFNKYRSSIINSLKSELVVIQFNARGMNDLVKFHSILEFVATLKLDFHILVISETWIKTHNSSFYNIDGFCSIFSCRNDRPGGGIVMYVRNDVKFQIIRTDESQLDFHYIQIKVPEFFQNHLTAIYRPPDADINNFLDVLELVIHKKYNNIILGDINIPLNKPSPIVTDFINILLGYGIAPTNTYETRSLSRNILDHVLCGFDGVQKVSNATIFSDISDHNFIASSIVFNYRRVNKLLEKKITDFNRVNTVFNDFLISLPLYDCDPNTTLTLITSKYEELITKYTRVSVKSVKVKNTYCPWLTYDIWKLIKKKELLLKKRKCQQNNPNNVNSNAIDYCLLIQNVDRIIKREKYFSRKRYFEKRFADVPNQRELWKNINALLGRTHKNSSDFRIVSNGVPIIETKQIATEFNNYFVNIGEQLSGNIVSDRNIFKFGTCENISSTFFIKPTSATEITNIVNDLDNNKGGGPYLINGRVLKANSDIFSKILSNIFNNIFATGVYPSNLKLSKVIPVFKSGDKRQLPNYRPISTLPVIGKLFEKLLAVRINSFLNDNHLLYNFQYGFRKGSGTDVALVETIDLINGSLDKKLCVCAIFLDLKKAFDTVDHGLLLDKLYCYGFRGTSFNLIKSYLTNREQYVFVNGDVSNRRVVKYGVPQGSVLGPLFFLLFINDMGKLPLKGKLRLFADDAAIFFEVKDPIEGLQLMQHDLDLLHQYFSVNILSLNLPKTKYMIFRSIYKPLTPLPNLTISNVNIELVHSYRYLGMILDSHLTWQSHIDMVRSKISPIIGFIRKASYFIPTKVLRCIYFAFIHSRITYGLIIYGASSLSRLRKLQVLQNRCIKAIYKLPWLYSSNDLYVSKSEGILPLKALYFQQVVKHVHRNKTNSLGFSNLNLTSLNHNYETRNKNNLKLCSISNEYGRKRISFIGPKLYNDLPVDIKQSHFVKFNKGVHNYLKSIVTKYVI